MSNCEQCLECSKFFTNPDFQQSKKGLCPNCARKEELEEIQREKWKSKNRA